MKQNSKKKIVLPSPTVAQLSPSTLGTYPPLLNCHLTFPFPFPFPTGHLLLSLTPTLSVRGFLMINCETNIEEIALNHLSSLLNSCQMFYVFGDKKKSQSPCLSVN